jgi:hypothetical protein
LPIGVGRKGRPDLLMKALTAGSARDMAHPLPMMTSGDFAVRSRSKLCCTLDAAANDLGMELACHLIKFGTFKWCREGKMLFVDFLPKDVPWNLDVSTPGSADHANSYGLFNHLGSEPKVSDPCSKFHIGFDDAELVVLLERTRTSEAQIRGTSHDDKRPPVHLRICSPSQSVDQSWTADH